MPESMSHPSLLRPGRLAVGLLLALTGACFTGLPPGEPLDTTEGASAGPLFACEPGEMLPCTCHNGASGVRTCQASGAEASGCVCAPQPDPTAASTTLPPPSSDDAPSASTGAASSTGASDGTDDTAGSSSGGGSSSGTAGQ